MTQTPLLLTPKEPRLTLLPQSQLKEPDRGQHEVLTPLIMKRKRGRPRILDAPGEVNPFAQTRLPEQVSCVFLVIYVSFIPFLVFGHFWQCRYKNTKILRNLCLHFARQNGQDGKNQKENHATKVTKLPKTKRQKYGMNKTKV